MELRTLRYFVAIAQAGNMHSAARQMRIAQPALSRQIRMLEEELGVVLFDRLSRGVRLTTAGKSFFDDATHVLWAAEQARQRAGLLAGGAIGQIRIGLHGPAHRYEGVQTALRLFHERYPNVRLALRHITSERQVQALEEEQIDIGFSYYPGAGAAQLRVQEIEGDRTMLAMRDDHPLADRQIIDLAELRDQPFLAGNPEMNKTTWHTLHAACAAAGFTPRLIVEGATAEPVIASLISAGLGVGFLPAAAATRSPRNLVFREVPGVSVAIRVVCLSNPVRGTPVAERFAAIVDEMLQSKP